MTKLTLDDKEYDIEDMTEDQKEILNLLNIGSNASALLNHITQCVQAVQQLKTNELKSSLEPANATKEET
mgnify:FL=1|tara:strand:- start:300 stop:509 length:210 start_codon:yes stop_codon:yes gene_type:complete